MAPWCQMLYMDSCQLDLASRRSSTHTHTHTHTHTLSLSLSHSFSHSLSLPSLSLIRGLSSIRSSQFGVCKHIRSMWWFSPNGLPVLFHPLQPNPLVLLPFLIRRSFLMEKEKGGVVLFPGPTKAALRTQRLTCTPPTTQQHHTQRVMATIHLSNLT